MSHDLVQDLWGDVEISWNYIEFEVRYESLAEEIKIGRCLDCYTMVPLILYDAHHVSHQVTIT